jgi:hypothetical protein
MLKLESVMKRRDLPDHIKEGLEPFDTNQIKFTIGSSTFFMLDLLIIMPLLFPIIKTVLYLTLPLLILISVWALTILFRKAEDTEMESILHLGCLGIIGSFYYYVLAMKYNYMVGIHSPFYYVLMFLIYLTIIYFFVRNELNKYSSLKKDKEKNTCLAIYFGSNCSRGRIYVCTIPYVVIFFYCPICNVTFLLGTFCFLYFCFSKIFS